MSNQTVRLSLNFEAVNKDVPNKNYALLTKAKYWRTTEVTLGELCSHIGAGHPFMPGVIDAHCDRKKEHCNFAQVLALDIDQGMSTEEAIAHDFIKRYCWLAYTSPSHTEQQHKFRLVFRLSEPVQENEAIERCIAYLLHLIPQGDGACKDASRFYFGSTTADFFISNDEAVLAADFAETAARYIERQKQELENRKASAKKLYAHRLDRGDFDGQDEMANAMHALSFIPPRVPGTGTYPLCRDVLWSLCDLFGIDEAISIMAQHSPTTTPSDWDVERIARQFKPGAGITKATLFGMAKKFGYRPLKKSSTRPKSAKKHEPSTSEIDTDSDEFEGGKPHFWSTPEQGLVWESYEKSEEDGSTQRSRTRIGNHLEAIAYINSLEDDDAALLLEFKNQQGQLCRWTMPRRTLGADTGTLIGELLGRGYGLVYEQKRKLARYLTELGTEVTLTYTVTDSTGWVKGAFVLPNRTYGSDTLRFRDVELKPADCPIEIKGTLDGWRSEVAAKCADNSRLIFAIGAAFAAPMLPTTNIESGGFHLVGGTSQGKTTALNVAASVVGIKELPHWRTTTNGLESTATAYNHLLLPLDEIGQAEPKDVGAIAYMLANGQGKARMRRDLSRSTPKSWRLLFLSSGEIGLKDYLKQAGISIKGGQEVRLPDLPAIPKDSQYGVFESIGQFETPVQFVTALESAIQNHRGSALDDYLSKLVVDNQQPDFAKQTVNRLFEFARELSANYSDAAVSRVAKRFALVWVALHLAHSYGLLPFPVEQCDWAVKTMFTDWVNTRGGDGSIEIKQAMERIEHLFVSNEHSDRIYQADGGNDQTVRNLLAYRKLDPFEKEVEFWVPTAIFNKEFCESVDKQMLIKALQEKSWLRGPRGYYFVFCRFWRESGEPGESDESKPDPVSNSTDSLPTHGPASHSESVSQQLPLDSLDSLPTHGSVNQGEQAESIDETDVQPLSSLAHLTHHQKHDVGKAALEIGDRAEVQLESSEAIEDADEF